MTTNYDEAKDHAERVRKNQPTRAAEIQAFLAIADELRAIRELLESFAGVTGLTGGGKGRRFIRVFDEAP